VTTARSDSDRRYERHNSVWYWLIYGISAGLLALLLGIAIAAVFLPRIVGAVPLTVLTRSMEPAVPAGTLLIARPIEHGQVNEIRVGDIISFLPQGSDRTLITHRVIRVTQLDHGGVIFTTQGDANRYIDAPVRDFQVRAKLWYSIPGIGWLNDLGNPQGNRSWVMPLIVSAAFLYAGYTVVSSAFIYLRRRRGRAGDGAEGADDARSGCRIDAP
jgi:signal peptidase